MQFGAIPGLVLPHCRFGSILAYLDATNADPWRLVSRSYHRMAIQRAYDEAVARSGQRRQIFAFRWFHTRRHPGGE
jgi:hypothetical protein